MTSELSYRDAASIGGPMSIGEGYRWNIPVVNYAFDKSFLDYFGTNGVAAVESAIQMLNDLPVASVVNAADYSERAIRVNYSAGDLGLTDLKSAALSSLLEQMGLAQPQRFIFSLHDYSESGGATN